MKPLLEKVDEKRVWSDTNTDSEWAKCTFWWCMDEKLEEIHQHFL